MIPFTLTIFTSYFLVKIKYYHSFFFFFIYLFYLRINLMWTLLLVLPFATQTTHLRYLSFRLLVKQLQILWFFDLHYCWPTSGNCFFWSERYWAIILTFWPFLPYHLEDQKFSHAYYMLMLVGKVTIEIELSVSSC